MRPQGKFLKQQVNLSCRLSSCSKAACRGCARICAACIARCFTVRHACHVLCGIFAAEDFCCCYVLWHVVMCVSPRHFTLDCIHSSQLDSIKGRSKLFWSRAGCSKVWIESNVGSSQGQSRWIRCRKTQQQQQQQFSFVAVNMGHSLHQDH